MELITGILAALWIVLGIYTYYLFISGLTHRGNPVIKFYPGLGVTFLLLIIVAWPAVVIQDTVKVLRLVRNMKDKNSG